MIKTVFFDFYDTVVTTDPSREELQRQACQELGVSADTSDIPRGYWYADDFLSRENARLSIQKRSPEEKMDFWASYEYILLKEAGIEITKELALKIVNRLRQLDRKLVLFNDVIPAMSMLKERGLFLGLISNLNYSLDSFCDELGLTPYLDLTLTSSEIGSEKPQPPIFLAALKCAGASPSEAIHVGDQYQSDVRGAQGVGINPLLLDRFGFWENISDCPRIQSLEEVVNHL